MLQSFEFLCTCGNDHVPTLRFRIVRRLDFYYHVLRPQKQVLIARTNPMAKCRSPFPKVDHEVDLCVVGGGMAGLAAALSAARHGAKVVLMHDRPVLGGNASSECRVHICGADRHNRIPHMRETGILEELRLENLRRNPQQSFSIWDLILYEKAKAEPNLTLLLNCSCQDATMEGDRIASVTGWQLTTQTHHVVSARLFADCSGDGVLAPLSGADFRMGREARSEFGESIAPEVADQRTMGMTCLFQAREYDSPQPFEPPPWIRRFERWEDLPYAGGQIKTGWWRMGYWWIELGGQYDSIRDTERLRDELLKITLGVWDFIKNRSGVDAENWALEWLQFLPAKRESRRFLGDHVLSQNDVAAGGRSHDLVAYGGWTMDDHHPAGFEAVQLGAPATIFHPAPSPFGIPYRCLYSRNVANLMFAGRNASCTHAAMSSTRVMGTCMSMGQAVGAAAALAVAKGIAPRDVGAHMDELQQALLADDAYLPWVTQRTPELTRSARLEVSRGEGEPLRDGINRQVGDDPHCWTASPGDHASYLFDAERDVREVTLILDSAMERLIQMSYHQEDDQLRDVPGVMPEAFRIQTFDGKNWKDAARVADNYQRLVRVPLNCRTRRVRFVLDDIRGAGESRVYGFYLR
jgi:hypothetical protein